MTSLILLAAGDNTRMISNKPKVLQKLSGKTLIQHIIDTVSSLSQITKVFIVYKNEILKSIFSKKKTIWIRQEKALGTAHAVSVVLPYLSTKERVLLLCGDVPLISEGSLEKLIESTCEKDLGLIVGKVENPYGFGRIIRDIDNNITSVVEEKQASCLQKKIKEINSGIYIIAARLLLSWLPKISITDSEYHLTNIVYFAYKNDMSIKYIEPENNFEILGVNSFSQLIFLEKKWKKYLFQNFIRQGVFFADYNNLYIRCDKNSLIGRDTFIDTNVILQGNINIGYNCSIGANCILTNCEIMNDVTVLPNTMIENSKICSSVVVGPFSHIHSGTVIGEKSCVGNFVEIKNTHTKHGLKAKHLSYIGDSTIGNNCNIGSGVVTCNYNGDQTEKLTTNISDNVFVGANSELIAPLSI